MASKKGVQIHFCLSCLPFFIPKVFHVFSTEVVYDKPLLQLPWNEVLVFCTACDGCHVWVPPLQLVQVSQTQ